MPSETASKIGALSRQRLTAEQPRGEPCRRTLARGRLRNEHGDASDDGDVSPADLESDRCRVAPAIGIADRAKASSRFSLVSRPHTERYYYYYEDPRTKEHKRLSAEYVAQELRRQEEQERERSGHRKPQKAQRSAYDTTNGTTDPQPGWWVPWGSVRNALVKRRKVDANVTLAEKREDVGGNGSGSRQ